MVVFTCGHCGESVQKPKVEKHYLTKCRNRNPNLSCMDCFKDFYGQDYETHIKCISEEQRYSGKGFVAKEKKGEQKQNAWVEMVQSVLDEQKNAPKNVLRIIETVSKHTNTPRKKAKFMNFVKNVCGNRTNPKDVEAAWDLISVKLSSLSNAQNLNGSKNQQSNGKVHKNEDAKENGDVNKASEEHTENGHEVIEETKTKKQKKEEKKRKKYEAELQSAAIPQGEGEEEIKLTKKEKKNKNNGIAEDNKKSKRKRTDTTTSENGVEGNIDENGQVNGDKSQKKKQKAIEENGTADESLCLHDQNVALAEEPIAKTDKFNWHEIIQSVLEKKGCEIPFKRLQKKVLSEYSEVTGREVDDKIVDKFIKKLKSAPNVKVDKNKVILEQ